jgi:MoxR-like ATPase
VTITPQPQALSTGEVVGFRTLHARLGDAIEIAVRGKRSVIDLVLVAMFADGHVLIDDVPGTGKTTLARSISAALGGINRRIQFTPDLLPSDVTGTSVYDPRTGEVRFRPGPVFANVVLADEINRAAAKTQSAMLEVMAEKTVTSDGVVHLVLDPFLVVATQNPIDLDGTYQLPEAQLDRFLIRVQLGYPDIEHELEVLQPAGTAGSVGHVPTVTSPEEIVHFSRMLRQLFVADPLLRYIRSIGVATREDPRLKLGASPRGLRSLVKCVQVYAASQGRNYVVPSDVQQLAEPVLAHRLVLTRESTLAGTTASQVVADALAKVDVPRPTS